MDHSPAGVNRMVKLHDWWTTLRAANLPTVWSNVVLGVGLSGLSISNVPTLPFLSALIGTSSIYLAGMAMNDGFDAAFDRACGSARAVAAGRITPRWACAIGLALLLFGFACVIFGGMMNATTCQSPYWVLAAAGLSMTVVTYNLVHRWSGWLSAALMAICRICVPLLTALLITDHVSAAVWMACAAIGSWTIGVTLIGRGERGGEPRIGGGLWWMMAAALMAVPLIWLSKSGRLDAAAGGLLITLVAWIPAIARRCRSNDRPGAVCWAIAGFGILDGGLLLAGGQLAWASVCMVLAALTLGAQRVGRGS